MGSGNAGFSTFNLFELFSQSSSFVLTGAYNLTLVLVTSFFQVQYFPNCLFQTHRINYFDFRNFFEEKLWKI